MVDATGATIVDGEGDSESSALLLSEKSPKIPKDTFHLAYIIYFTLGTGYLLAWNTFITAVDYFSYIYPDASVDRVFAIVYMIVGLICLLFIVAYAHKSHSYVRINVGLVMFVISLLVVPIMDVTYIKGRPGVYGGFDLSVAAIALSGVGDALVQGSIIGSAGEMPDRYMQAVVAGTAASGVPSSMVSVTSPVNEDSDDVTVVGQEESAGNTPQKLANGLLSIPLSNVERLRSTLSTVSLTELIELIPHSWLLSFQLRNIWFEAATVVAVAPPVELPTGSVLKSALAGGLSSALSTSLLYPMDTIKTRVQASSTLSFLEIISTLPQVGIQGLYRGSIPAVLGQFTSHGLRSWTIWTFPSQDHGCHFQRKERQ